jgi:hypothetical protein
MVPLPGEILCLAPHSFLKIHLQPRGRGKMSCCRSAGLLATAAVLRVPRPFGGLNRHYHRLSLTWLETATLQPVSHGRGLVLQQASKSDRQGPSRQPANLALPRAGMTSKWTSPFQLNFADSIATLIHSIATDFSSAEIFIELCCCSCSGISTVFS